MKLASKESVRKRLVTNKASKKVIRPVRNGTSMKLASKKISQ